MRQANLNVEESESAKDSKAIAKWIGSRLPVHSEEPIVALVCAGWIHGLSRLGRDIEPAVWLDTLQAILSQVDRSWVMKEPENLLSWLIWSCEVPLALANQLAPMGNKDRVVVETLDRLALALEGSAERPSPWLRNGGTLLRPCLACIARCRWLADRLGARKWFAPQRKALTQLISTTLAVTASDGKPLLLDPQTSEQDSALWPAMLALSGQNKKLIHSMRELLPKSIRLGLTGQQTREAKKSSSLNKLKACGIFDETAEMAILRRGVDQKSFRLAVDFAADPIWLDLLGNDGERIFSGNWEVQVSRNGQLLEVDHGWTEVCWFTDDDVDYLELQCEVEGKCLIQRQMMLAREEGLFFLSDTLLGSDVADWEIETRFPIAAGLQFRQELKNVEGTLVSSDAPDEPHALLLPLGLPEWRRQATQGELVEDQSSIVLTKRVHGQRVYSPLAVVVRKKHRRAAYTWRQLTVAEDLRIVGPEDALAYRLQLGNEHWVFYRSLHSTTRRTAMGLHVGSEFYAGRFNAEDGDFDPLLEVDPELA